MRRPLFWVSLLLSLLAIWQLFLSGAPKRQERVAEYFSDQTPWRGETLTFTGRVCGKECKDQKYYFLIQIDDSDVSQEVALSQQIISCLQSMRTNKLRCLLSEGQSMPEYGSYVAVSGHFSFYGESTNPGEFNAAQYYQGLETGGFLSDAEICLKSKNYDRTGEGLYRLRSFLAGRLEKLYPPKEAGVMKALLLGERSGLDGELKELYKDGGIIHILSISGLHITLLGMGLYRLLKGLSFSDRVAVPCSSLVLFLYGMMTGMSVSACRAIGMFFLRMLAQLWGRTYDMLTALGVLAACMLCLKPVYALLPGFWLSFGALAGVGLILPVLEGLSGKRKGTVLPGEGIPARLGRKLSETVVSGLRAGLSVSLATMPVLLHSYYEIPVYSMLLNLLVIPLMTVVVFCGFVSLLISWLGFLGVADLLVLRGFEALCILMKRLPLHSWNPGCPEIWQMVLYYLLLAAALLFLQNCKKLRECRYGFLTALIPVLIFAIPVRAHTGITFLDVGQGDCVCLRQGSGSTWIYDCGSTSREEVGKNVLIPYLKHEGIRRIEGIFLSHGDLDHKNGLTELFSLAQGEGIRIKRLILPVTLMDWKDEPFWDAVRAVPGLEIIYMGAGDRLDAGRISFLALHPRQSTKTSGEEEEQNENSLCLYVQLTRRRKKMDVLLTGDTEGKGEEALTGELKRYDISRVDILKCAHHGSKYATSEAFLEQLDAEVTVISCGRRNVYGHPHGELLARLESDGTKVFRTDRLGAIRFLLRGGKIFWQKSF